MATIHTILQGKGGVGKSLISAILAQYFIEKGTPAKCIDTDPVNTTFIGFKSLNVERLPLLEGDEINPRKFDDLVEIIAASTTDVVIDNGASSFVPLSYYLVSNKVPELLESMGHRLVIHVVITGGQAMLDTINGFVQMVKQFPQEAKFVIWLNPYFGAVQMDGKSFEETKAYKENKDRIEAMIQMPTLKVETFGRDISDMLKSKKTFAEALADNELSIMTRQRLKLVRDQLFSAIDQVRQSL